MWVWKSVKESFNEKIRFFSKCGIYLTPRFHAANMRRHCENQNVCKMACSVSFRFVCCLLLVTIKHECRHFNNNVQAEKIYFIFYSDFLCESQENEAVCDYSSSTNDGMVGLVGAVHLSG